MRRKPSILIAYPSCFHYPVGQGREQIKSSQLVLASYLSHHFPTTYTDLEILIGRPDSAVQIRRFERKARELLATLDYDILGLSCWTSLSYLATVMVARIWRELYPDRLIVVGGYHPTARPEDFVLPENTIDYVVRGEGEITFKEIAEAYSVTGRPTETKIVVGRALEPDDYVPINYDLVDEFIHTHFADNLGMLVSFLSRGCPFGCAFCMETLKTRRWRPASVEFAINEIQIAAERFKFSGFGFGDACFGVNRKWRKEFIRQLIQLKPSFWVLFETRPEYLEPDDIEQLGQIETQIQIGLESCSPKMLRIMNKSRQPERYITTFREASHRMSENGIVHGANLVFNHPGETQKTLEETMAVVDEELAWGQSTLVWTCHDYMHFPGSYVDNNRTMYEQRYGSQFLCPEWWKLDDNQYLSGRRVIPSSDLAGERKQLWRQMLKQRDRKMRDALTPKAFNLAAQAVNQEWQDDPRFVGL